MRSLPTPQEIYASEVIREFVRLSQITEGEDKLIAVYNSEALFHFFLEGQGALYYQSKKTLLEKIDEEKKKGVYISSLETANDLLKLISRDAKLAGIFGKQNLRVGEPDEPNDTPPIALEVSGND